MKEQSAFESRRLQCSRRWKAGNPTDMVRVVSGKRIAFWVAPLVLAVVVAGGLVFWRPFPPDTTPEGAYMRIAKNVVDERPEREFAYLETEAQWACYTIRDMRRSAATRIRKSYPENERERALAPIRAEAEANDGSEVYALYATRGGFHSRLRRDLSGVAKVEVAHDRATVETARGTRYPFRRRENGIWGITLFTAELLVAAERATRDLAMVNLAADDYDRSNAR